MSSKPRAEPAAGTEAATGTSAHGWRAWLGRHALDLTPLQTPGFRQIYLARLAAVFVYGILGVTVSWQAWTLTQSSLQVAFIGVGLAAGTIVGLLVGGSLADRVDRRLLMVLGRSSYVAVVAFLLVNSLRAEPQLSWIYVATVLSGLTGGISAPSLMATVATLLPPPLLPAAGALNALAEQLGRLVGPLMAGALLAWSGSSACYAVALAGALMTAVALFRLPPKPPAVQLSETARHATKAEASASLWAGWRISLVFVFRSPVIAGTLLLDCIMALCVTPWFLLPQLGVQTLGGDAQLMGALTAAPALGAMAAAAVSGWTRRLERPGRFLVLATVMWGCTLAAVGLITSVWWVLAMLLLAGAWDTLADIVRGALLQRHTPDALRGRMSALWLLEVHVSPAAGGVLLGVVAQRRSVPAALLLGGGVCMVLASWLGAMNKSLRAATWSPEVHNHPPKHVKE